MTAIAVQNKAAILEALSQGKMLKEIAKEYGVSKQAIWAPLAKDPDYRAALKLQAAAMVDEAKELTWAAREGLDIARAREITKFAFRYAESMDAGTWGQKGNQFNILGDGPISIQVVSYSDQDQAIAAQQVQCNTDSSVIEGEKG